MAGSEIKVNQISPKQTCTTITVGNSGNTIIIPAGATITNNGTATGFSRTGTVNWSSTIQTSGFTASSPNGYFCNTTSAAFTVTLPSSATAGDIVAFADYAQTFNTNNLTLNPNGLKIEGATTNVILSTQGASVTLVYSDSTKGWIIVSSAQVSELPRPAFVTATGGTVTTCGNYKIHTFTSSGCFVVTSAGNPSGSNSVDYLVVAGGGAGGNNGPGAGNGSGGAAGGFRESVPSPAAWTASPLASNTSLPVSATTYPVTVGGGGGGNTCHSSGSSSGASGNLSTFSTITSAGGGGGSGNGSPTGLSGGSGGGGATIAGTGNTPPVSPSQGNPGGIGSGAGGGATAAGGAATPPAGPGPGTGGTGAGTGINPSPSVGAPGPSAPLRYFAGGGGSYFSPSYPDGGVGGGGTGHPTLPLVTSGTTNTGGGGGGNGATSGTSGSGGSGIVVIRYKYQ